MGDGEGSGGAVVELDVDGNCVQVAPWADRVLVRDSKHPEGPALTLVNSAPSVTQ